MRQQHLQQSLIHTIIPVNSVPFFSDLSVVSSRFLLKHPPRIYGKAGLGCAYVLTTAFDMHCSEDRHPWGCGIRRWRPRMSAGCCEKKLLEIEINHFSDV